MITKGHTEELGIVVTTTQFDEILKAMRKTCSGPEKMCYKLLEELPNNFKALSCLLISSSINNSYDPVNWKEFQLKKIPKQDKDRLNAENYQLISITNSMAKLCELL